LKMRDMGVARFGINQNSAIDIIAECRALS
jgi:hypothetical protein